MYRISGPRIIRVNSFTISFLISFVDISYPKVCGNFGPNCEPFFLSHSSFVDFYTYKYIKYLIQCLKFSLLFTCGA